MTERALVAELEARRAAAVGAGAARVGRRSAAAWIVYDIANTLFSMNVISLYFPLWVVNDLGGPDSDYGLANSFSQALIFLSAPLLGALSDQSPRRLPFLAVTTLVVVVATSLIGMFGLGAALVCFVIANYAYQAGLLFYDSLLPSVSTDANRGTIGGLSVGLGYLGSFMGVGMGLLLLRADPAAKPLLFLLTAVGFLLFALPCLLWVRERRRAVGRFGPAAVGRALAELRETVGRARRYPGLARFLIGRIFYADAAATIVAFMGIYVTNEVGFTQTEAQLVLLVGIASGVLAGVLWGLLCDRAGPKRTLTVVLGIWAVVFLLAAGIPLLHLPGPLFWLVAVLGGIGLSGLAASDRPFMLRLSPPRYLGQFYGLYAMVGRFSAILGPLLWATIVNGLNLGRPAAVLSLLVMILVAWLILRPVGDAMHRWAPEDLEAPSAPAPAQATA